MSLLEISIFTSIIKDFQHRLLTGVETTDVKNINVNIGFLKIDVFIETDIVFFSPTSIFRKTDVVILYMYMILKFHR